MALLGSVAVAVAVAVACAVAVAAVVVANTSGSFWEPPRGPEAMGASGSLRRYPSHEYHDSRAPAAPKSTSGRPTEAPRTPKWPHCLPLDTLLWHPGRPQDAPRRYLSHEYRDTRAPAAPKSTPGSLWEPLGASTATATATATAKATATATATATAL